MAVYSSFLSLINGAARTVNLASNTLNVSDLQIGGIELSGASGSSLVGSPGSGYVNFTPTSATIAGALSGIDSALGLRAKYSDFANTDSIDFIAMAGSITANVNVDPASPLNIDTNGLTLNASSGLQILSGLDSYTALLLHLDDSLVDSSSYANTVSKAYGTSSYVPGKFGEALDVVSGGYPYVANYPSEFNFGSGNFTIEMWASSVSLASIGYIAAAGMDGVGQDWALHTAADGTITWDGPGPFSSSSGAFKTDGLFHHYAFVRNGSTFTMYVDGVSVGSGSSGASIGYTNTYALSFGGLIDPTPSDDDLVDLTAILDEIRVSVGIARYTSNFTPPSAPFGSSSLGVNVDNSTIGLNGSNQLEILSVPTSLLSGDVSLTSQVSGTLPVANGGTGQASALTPYGVIYAASSSAMASTSAGTAGYVLTANSGSAPTWQAAAVSGITALTGDGTATGPGSVAFTLATVNSNVGSFGSASSVATFTVNGKGLITAASNSAIQIAESQVTGLAASLALYLPLAGGTMSGAINMGSNKINDLADPTSAQDAATKNYVDTSTISSSLMTTAGDMIYENSTPAPARLPIGSSGQVLTVVAGLPSWQTSTVGANEALSNLSAVAINTSLLPGTDNSINLGSQSFSWAHANIHSLLSGSGATSVDVYNHQLSNGTSGTTIDWLNLELIDTASNVQLSWSTSGVEFNQLTASTVPYLNSSKILTSSAVTPTQLSYLDATSSIQTQLNGKLTSSLATNDIFVGNGSNIATAVAMSGDASIVASGALTLATVNSDVGTYGDSSDVAIVTVNGKGLITAVSTASITAPAGALTGTTLKSSVVSSSLTSLGIQAQALNMGSNQINDLANGTVSSDAINLGQLQAAISGLYWQGPAMAYADSNVPLTGGATLTIDGYAVQNGDLVILGNQTIASQNGEYTASGIGTAYTLTPNGLPTAAGDAWLILNGTVYGDTAFVANAAVPAATFTEFAGPTAYTFSAPLSLSGRTVSITQASGSANGYLSSTDWNTFNNKQAAGNYITALTGDATASGPGSAALTLATVNSNVGSFGSSTSIPSFTVNAKGLITAASGNAVVAPAGTLSGTTLNSTVVSSSLTSVGIISSGTWEGTAVAIAYGGTGQTTKQSAFDALSPLGTAGDILYYNGSHNVNLGIGSTGQILTVVAGEPAWAANSVSPSSIALTDNHILVGNSSNLAADVAMSGDVAIVASGATTIQPGVVTASKLATVTDGITTDQNGAGSTIEVLAAPAVKEVMIAGQAYSASTLYAVRLAVPADTSYVAGRMYAADNNAATSDLWYVIGLIYPASSVAAAGSITVTKMGLINVPSHGFTPGAPLFLGSSGAITATPPSTTNLAVERVGIVRDANNIEVQIAQIGIN